MELVRYGHGVLPRQSVPNAPTLTVIFRGTEGYPDVGLVRVPAATGMSSHQHNGSDVILTSTAKVVRTSKSEESAEVHVGDSGLVRKDAYAPFVYRSSKADPPAEPGTGRRNWRTIGVAY